LVAQAKGCKVQGAHLTAEGTILGTPAYMAPEIARGRAIDGRADLYALGCVAYWLLTGRRVFEGESSMDVISAHLSTPPESPSSRLGKAIPEPLEALVLRCLAKEPGARPATALELERLLASLALEDSWTDIDARGWWAQN